MHSNDLEACGKKCCLFWFHSEVKGVGAATTDFGPVPDFVVLLFDGYAMILVSKNQNFIIIS